MRCEYCEIIERKNETEIIYQNDDLVVAVKDLVATPGQVTIFPKKHFTIMETVPDQIIKKCFAMANKLSIAVFESLGCQGTNIIVQNGHGADQKVPHFGIEIIPRKEGDKLKLEWQPKQLMEDEMDAAYTKIKPECDKLGEIVPKKTATKKRDDNGVIIIRNDKDEENYLLKSLKRIP